MSETKPDLLDRFLDTAVTQTTKPLPVPPFRLPDHSLFLVVEGIDGAGKTTLVADLAHALTQLSTLGGHRNKIKVLSDPGTTPLGEEIRHILKHSQAKRCVRAEALLFLAARAQLVNDEIVPALDDRGAIVLLDRFTLSTMAYQGYGSAAGDAGWTGDLREVCAFAVGRGRPPHLTLILDLPVAQAVERCRQSRPGVAVTDRLESRLDEWESRRQGYLIEAQILGPVASVLDASQDPETVLRNALETIRRRFRCPPITLAADPGAPDGDRTVGAVLSPTPSGSFIVE